MKKISIAELIEQLQEEQRQGATTVFYKGTLMTDNGNAIILTTEPQI